MVAPLRSIGQVLTILKADFPDVSISKIRFLESEGLVAPERAPSGYRRYADADIERLHYILRVQRDHYLPLRVIREHLDAMDRGDEPPTVETPSAALPVSQPTADLPVPRQQAAPNRAPIRLSRRELLQASGLAEGTLVELERLQLIVPRRGTTYYGREALTVCVVARKLAAYGMDSRHLRAIRQAAEREAGLVEQAIQPYLRRNSAAANDVATEVTQLVVHAHAAMMHSLLERG